MPTSAKKRISGRKRESNVIRKKKKKEKKNECLLERKEKGE